MRFLLELGPGLFVLAWWGIVIAVLVCVWPLVVRLRLPGDRPAPVDDDPVTGYDLAYLDPMLPLPGLVALASLRQRGIVTIDDAGKLHRGDVALPADAPAIEVELLQRANGTPAREAAVAAADHAKDFHLRRNRERGLLMIRDMERAVRFVAGCAFALVITVAVIRLWWWGVRLGWEGIGDEIGLLASAAIVGWLGHRSLRRPWQTARRNELGCAQVARAHELPKSWRGWPAADLPHEQVELALGLWGPAIVSGGGARREWAAYVDRAPRAEDTIDPQAAAFRIDAALVRDVFGGRRPEQRVALAQRARLIVLVAGAITIATVVWLGMASGPPRASGPRSEVEPPELEKVVAPGEHGLVAELEPMPAAVRGRRPPGCDPAVAKRAEESVLGILARREHAMDYDPEVADPETEAAALREHVGEPMVAYAATSDRLYRIDLASDGRARAIEVAPLMVRVGASGPRRMMESYAHYATSLRGLAFDTDGLLWGVGDEQLYMCSAGTGICVPKGIMPIGTRGLVLETERAEKGQVLAIGRGAETAWVQRAGLPGAFAELADSFMHTIELCTETGPSLDTGAEIVTPPADAGDGAFFVVLRQDGALSLSRLRFGVDSPIAAFSDDVVLGLDEPPVALATVPDGVLAFSGRGAIVLVDPTTGHVRARSETGREFRAATSRVVPDSRPAERESH